METTLNQGAEVQSLKSINLLEGSKAKVYINYPHGNKSVTIDIQEIINGLTASKLTVFNEVLGKIYVKASAKFNDVEQSEIEANTKEVIYTKLIEDES